MAKRKGSDYAPSPGTAAVISSPPSSEISTSASTSAAGASSSDVPPASTTRSSSAVFASSSSVSWDETKALVADLAAELRADFSADLARSCLEANADLEDRRKSVSEKSSAVKSTLRTRIDDASAELSERKSDLAAASDHVSSLASEAESLRRRNDGLDEKRVELLRRTEMYRTEAAATVEAVDEVEMRQRREVMKIKHQISLYGKITGIRWDYDEEEKLKGEVNVPSKNETRLFSIDPLDHSEYDVANELWDIMDGKEPRLSTAEC